jgi:hypothetical protein
MSGNVNPYLRAVPMFEDTSNPLTAQAPTSADAWTANASAFKDWSDAQRQDGIARGLINPDTGWPTSAALVDAAHQYGNALMGSTSAPGGGGGLPTSWSPKIAAERIAQQLTDAGYDVSLNHWSNVAGQSSYMKVVDRTTGRYMPEARISDHMAGQKMQYTHNILSAEDEPGFLEATDKMRALGPTQLWRQEDALKKAGLDGLVGTKRDKAINSLKAQWDNSNIPAAASGSPETP